MNSAPNIPFYGKEILEMAMAALLQGSNLLLTGAKATGKNILAENLAWIFGRPSYNISFNVNTDSSTLIGTDTFRNNQVDSSGKEACTAVRKRADLASSMRSIWQKMMQPACFMPPSTHRRMIDVPGYETDRAASGYPLYRNHELRICGNQRVE